jgi:tRNA A-37 threonylcarbamoyl transferase component Bud32
MASSAGPIQPPNPISASTHLLSAIQTESPTPPPPTAATPPKKEVTGATDTETAIPVTQTPVFSMCDIGELAKRPTRKYTEPIKDGLTPSSPDNRFENGIARSVTSPSLLTMVSATSSASSTRPPPLSRNTSEIKVSKKKLFGHHPPSPPRGGSPSTFIQRFGSFLGKKGGQQKQVGTLSKSGEGITPLSLTQSTDTSNSGSPPSPSSRESTHMEDARSESSTSTPKQAERTGSSASDRAEQPKFGITWGPDTNEDGYKIDRLQPRRSLSHNELRDMEPGFLMGLVELKDTRSYRSAVGVGMKARRLSTALPEDFNVGYCELDEEFKSSSHIPGRRGKTIGLGATATVKLMYKCGDQSGTYFAVKEFRKRRSNEETEEEYVKKIKSEYSVAAALEHPNIVTTFRLCTHHGRWNHVMEYCQYGELFHYYKSKAFAGQELKDRLCIFKQVLRGVDYLHSHGIAHRDIKLENILMNADGHVKITDFGVSEVFAGEHPGFRESGGKCGTNMTEGAVRRCEPGICGSFPYMAPEVIAKKGMLF